MRKLLIVAFAVAICFRLAFYFYGLEKLPASSDEAWPSLMANHILKGEFPVVYWGQSYMGTQESFVQAVLIVFFGLKIWAMRLYPLAFGILYVFVSYLLAKRIYGERAGLLTVVLLAIPVPYLMLGSVMIPPDNYLPVTTLGSMALVLLADLVFADPRHKLRHFALLGFVLGFAFWLHILCVSYIGVAILFLFLRDKLVFLRIGFWAMVLWFVIGSFPLLWYNANHDFATFTDVAGQIPWGETIGKLKGFLGVTTQFLIGMKVMLYADNNNLVPLPVALQWMLAASWIGVVALVLVLRFKDMIRLAFLSVRKSDGTWMLIALLCATVLAFCRSDRSTPGDVRYVLPMMSGLPILFAFGLSWIYDKAKYVAFALLVLVVGAQLWGNILLAREWNNPRRVAVDLQLPDTKPLHAFLKEHDITRAYAHYWVSYRITLEAKEGLICSEPYNERFPGREVKFIDDVRAADKVAYICHPTMLPADEFQDLLEDVGGKWRKRSVGDFVVYYDFVPPYGKDSLVEIPRDGWLITACTNQSRTFKLTDNNHGTAWDSETEQSPGMWLQVDLGLTQRVSKVRFDLARWHADYPRGYRLLSSVDAVEWKEVLEGADVGGALFWEGSHPRYMVKGEFFNASFAPVEARHLRVVLTKGHHRFWWSIAELRIFGPGQ
ncbi:MAG: hypothetical protein C0404_00440 [Verrucomicrobia bacterium]|nr:hypothetical protein [Verrucomicrobiota bacterium]